MVKKWWPLLAFGVVVLVVFGWLMRTSKADYKLLEGKFLALSQKYDTDTAARDKLLREKEEALKKESELRKAAEEREKKLNEAKAKKEKEFEDYKKWVSSATPNQLVNDAELFVGVGEVAYVPAFDYFSTTRRGMVLTLTVFHEKVKFEGLYGTELQNSAGLRTQLESYRRSELTWDDQKKVYEIDKRECRDALASARQALNAADRAMRVQLWKGAAGGAAVTAGIGLVAYLVKTFVLKK